MNRPILTLKNSAQMCDYHIYYQGRNINQVRATSPSHALRVHYKGFLRGMFGTAIAIPAHSSPEQIKYARQESMKEPK